jgi:hypothetical protein
MVRCGPDVEQALDHTVCRPYSIPNPAVAGCNSDLAQYSNTPSHTFRARAQLVRRSHRSMMHAAQGRPRKRGALHNRGAAKAGSTSTIWMSPPCQDFGELSRVTTFILSLRYHYACLNIDVNDQLRDRQRRGRQINNNR